MTRFPARRDDLARMTRDLEAAQRALTYLSDLPYWAERHDHDDDGYTAGGQGGPRSADSTSTTARAAESLATRGDDPFTVALSLAVELLHEHTYGLCGAANKFGEYLRPRQLERGRANGVPLCPACDQPAVPRVISGFCPACRKAWERDGYPDRQQFINRRKRAS